MIATIAWRLVGTTLGQEATAPTPQQAAAALTERGLVKKGYLWISPDEALLQQSLDRLPRLRKRWNQARERIVQEQRRRGLLRELLSARAEIAPLLKQKDLTKTEQQELSAKASRIQFGLDQLGFSSTDEFEEDDAIGLRPVVKEFVVAHHELLLASARVERLTDDVIVTGYDRWNNDPRVIQSLRALGDKAGLGPRKTYRIPRRKSEPTLRLTLTDWVPTYQEEGVYRIWGLLGEDAFVEFQYRPDRGFSLIPLAMLRKAGIPLADDAPRVILSQGQRVISGYRTTLPELRLGARVLKNLPAVVLPDGESLGRAQLGASAFRDVDARLVPQEFRLRLTTREPDPAP
ncbi:MAG: retroviral-like aspartic protease family protein [Planctomycetales bacterium]